MATAQGAQGQARANKAGIAMQQEQLALARDSTALQAQEAETERRRRAMLTDSTLVATALSQGLDPGAYGTVGTLQAENERITKADIGAIKLGNFTQQRQSHLQDRSLALQSSVWSANARNAWVMAGIQVAGAAVQAGRAGMGVGSLSAPSTAGASTAALNKYVSVSPIGSGP